MTREEAIKEIRGFRDECNDDEIESVYKKAFDMAIEALEQKAVLDKIIEEIEIKLKEPQYQHVGEDWQVGLIIAEDIIYKYKDKAESEEEQ